MASSPVAAIRELYESLPAAAFANGTRPPFFVGMVPETDASANQQRPPYTSLEDDGRSREVQSDNGGPEGGTVTLSVYDFDLGDVGKSALAIRFGGQSPAARAGLDGGALVLDQPFEPVSLTLVSERVLYAGVAKNAAGNLQRLHQAELVFRVVVGLRSAG